MDKRRVDTIMLHLVDQWDIRILGLIPHSLLHYQYSPEVPLKMGLWNQMGFSSLTSLALVLVLPPQESSVYIALSCFYQPLLAPLLPRTSACTFPNALPPSLFVILLMPQQTPLPPSSLPRLLCLPGKPVLGPWTDSIGCPVVGGGGGMDLRKM